MQIYCRQGTNNPLIHPWLQSGENACAEQPAMHCFLLQVCSICKYFSPCPEEGQDKVMVMKPSIKLSGLQSGNTSLLQKSSRKSSRSHGIIPWSLKHITVFHFSKLPLENLGYLAISG